MCLVTGSTSGAFKWLTLNLPSSAYGLPSSGSQRQPSSKGSHPGPLTLSLQSEHFRVSHAKEPVVCLESKCPQIMLDRKDQQPLSPSESGRWGSRHGGHRQRHVSAPGLKNASIIQGEACSSYPPAIHTIVLNR